MVAQCKTLYEWHRRDPFSLQSKVDQWRESEVKEIRHQEMNAKMVTEWRPTVDYLLRTQGPDGFWGALKSADLQRSPRVVSLLSWWTNATSQTRPGYVDAPATEAADRYVAFLVAQGVSHSAGNEYGVGSATITSGMAGIAVADWLSLGASFGVGCAGC